MNMTSMLDILIILFFAQAIEFKNITDQKISECESSVADLQSENSELYKKVNPLQTENRDLAQSNKKLASDNEELYRQLSQKTNELAEKSEQYSLVKEELEIRNKELKKIKSDIHLVGESIDFNSVLDRIVFNNSESSKEDITKRIIDFIQTQHDIQKQTEKEITYWIITLSNSYDKRDGKANLILRLFIRGKENIAFQKLSEKRPWDWGKPRETEPDKLKDQLLAALNDKNIIPDTDIQRINIILCFQDKTSNNSSLLTPQIEVFDAIFKDVFLQLQNTYSSKQSADNPNGRGLGEIRVIPIPFDPRDIHPLDPELLIK